MYRICLSYLALTWCLVGLPSLLIAQESVGQPLVSYSQSHPLMPINSAPMVQVFESGAVEVNRPVGNKRPGSYVLSVSVQQLSQIKQLMASSSDVNTAVKEIARASSAVAASSRAGEQTRSIETDPTTTIMTLNPVVVENGAGVAFLTQAETVQTLTVQNLALMSESANKPAIQSMRELELLLLSLYESAGN